MADRCMEFQSDESFEERTQREYASREHHSGRPLTGEEAKTRARNLYTTGRDSFGNLNQELYESEREMREFETSALRNLLVGTFVGGVGVCGLIIGISLYRQYRMRPKWDDDTDL